MGSFAEAYNGPRCLTYRESTKRNKGRQRPTLGVERCPSVKNTVRGR